MTENKLICPFCQQELEICGKYTDGTSKVWCSKCNLFGDSKLFEELITTRKALGQAKKALVFINDNWDNVDCGRAELGACAFNGLEDISGWESYN